MPKYVGNLCIAWGHDPGKSRFIFFAQRFAAGKAPCGKPLGTRPDLNVGRYLYRAIHSTTCQAEFGFSADGELCDRANHVRNTIL